MVKVSTRRLALLAGASIMVGSASGEALAQETESPRSPEVSEEEPEAPGGGESVSAASRLGEIIVTAQRRSENLQSTPVAITALTTEALESRSIRTTQDLMQVVPGLQVSTQVAGDGGGSATFFLRGLGQERARQGVSPAVGIYVDDVYYPSLSGSVFSILDLEQVEVLRGPQGTLFGRSTLGGAIRYTTKKPEFNTSGYVQGTMGSYDRRDVSGSLNVAPVDWLALRLTAGHLETDGFVKQATGQPDAGGTRTRLVRAQVRARPSDALEIQLSAQYSDFDLTGFTYFVPSPIEIVPGSNVARWNAANPTRIYDSRYASQCTYCIAGTNRGESSHTEYTNVIGVITWDIGSGLSLKSLTAFQQINTASLFDADSSPLPISNITLENLQDTFSQELQVNGRDMLGGRLDWVAGLYYLDDTLDGVVPSTGLQEIRGVLVPPVLQDVITESRAVYVDGTLRITNIFSVLGGVRLSEDKKDSTSFATGTNTVVNVSSGKFPSTTWRAGLQAQWTRDIMSYATVSTGFRSGGFTQANSIGRTVVRFEPEDIISYEAGLRMDLFNRRFRFNPTVFYMDRNDMQIVEVRPDPTGGSQTYVRNAARAHHYGLELEAEAVVSRNLTLFGNVALLRTAYDEITSLPGATPAITLDSEFQRAPDFTYALGGTYKTTIGSGFRFSTTANWSWEGEQYSSPDRLFQVRLPAYGILNVRAEVTDPSGHWNLAAFVTNLTDSVSYVGGGDFAHIGLGALKYDLGRPREVGVTIRYDF